MNHSLLRLLAVCTGLVGPAVSAAADRLVLRNGDILMGELMDETSQTVNFRYEHNGSWATRTFARTQIVELIAEVGDQSDRGAQRDSDASEDSKETEDSPTPRPHDPARAMVAVIPLHGQVGGTVGEGVSGTFDALLVETCLEQAREAGAEIVVLDIHSPGGLVAEMEAICDSILAWQDQLRIVAHPRDAFSAAAIITLCCKEIVVRPNSLIGAATIVTGDNEGGVDALEAKFASPHYARQRQYMARSGHPYAVVAAMTIQERQLWWSPTAGFSEVPPSEGGDWREVDGSSTVLTMTGDDAVRWGLARAMAEDARDIAEAIGEVRDIELLDLTELVERHNRELSRRLGDLKLQFTNYFTALAALNQKMAAMFEAYNDRDDATVRTMQREIGREVAKVRNAGQNILRADKSLLAQRIAVPEAFVDRIEEDTELVSGITRLIDSPSTDQWQEAAARLNEVLSRWRDTLGM